MAVNELHPDYAGAKWREIEEKFLSQRCIHKNPG